MQYAQDSAENNSFKVRRLPQKLGDPFYSKSKMAVRCRELVQLAVKLHTDGPSALKCFDHVYAEHFKKTKAWIFKQRIDTMTTSLAIRKNRCDLIMRGENLDGFVGAPGRMAKNSIQNGINNNKKGKAIKRGTLILKAEEEAAARQITATAQAMTQLRLMQPVRPLRPTSHSRPTIPLGYTTWTSVKDPMIQQQGEGRARRSKRRRAKLGSANKRHEWAPYLLYQGIRR